MPGPVVVGTVPAATRSERRVDRWFYIAVALFMILLNIAAFGPSLVSTSERLGAPTTLVIAHGIVSFGFLLVFLTQAALVAIGQTMRHRRFGVVGAATAAVLVVLTYVMSIETARRGYDLSGDLQRLEVAGQVVSPDALRSLAVNRGIGVALNISQVISFATLIAAAIWFRHRPAIHKRLMLVAMLGVMTGPPFAHLFGHWPALGALVAIVQLPTTILLLSVSAIHDRLTGGHVHPVSVWVPLLVSVWFGVWVGVIGPSATWQSLAARLIG